MFSPDVGGGDRGGQNGGGAACGVVPGASTLSSRWCFAGWPDRSGHRYTCRGRRPPQWSWIADPGHPGPSVAGGGARSEAGRRRQRGSGTSAVGGLRPAGGTAWIWGRSTPAEQPSVADSRRWQVPKSPGVLFAVLGRHVSGRPIRFRTGGNGSGIGPGSHLQRHNLPDRHHAGWPLRFRLFGNITQPGRGSRNGTSPTTAEVGSPFVTFDFNLTAASGQCFGAPVVLAPGQATDANI